MDLFHQAADDLGEIAKAAELSPKPLADRLFAALIENDYGQYDGLIDILSPTLGADGLDHLKTLVLELAATPIAKPAKEDREMIGYGSGGPIYADDYAERRQENMVRVALQQIVDAQGDVDAFIAQHSEKDRTAPRVASEIARRLLAAGRPEDAWSAINAVEEGQPGWIPFEWEATRVAVLEALDRHEEAQQFRWACFESSFSSLDQPQHRAAPVISSIRRTGVTLPATSSALLSSLRLSLMSKPSLMVRHYATT
jgi:hypothetical protein